MKASRIIGAAISVLAAILILAGCSSEPTGQVNKEYMKLEVIKNSQCNSLVVIDLVPTRDAVQTANARKAREIAELNGWTPEESEAKLKELSEKLDNKVVECNSTSSQQGSFVAPAGAQAQPLGEIGPGSCWPADEQFGGLGPGDGFAEADGPKKAAQWLRANPKRAEQYHTWLTNHKDYYLIYEVVSEWDSLSEVERAARYTERLSATQLTEPIYVLNTYCTADGVVEWQVQVLPIGEWVFFIPGHEPGTDSMRPVIKAVCGNFLLPPPAVKPEGEVQVPPPGNPPPANECVENCGGNPPPGCTTPCNPPIWKDGGENIPGTDGNGGSDTPGAGQLQPPPVHPTTTYGNPPPAPPGGAPTGSTPTETQAPPPPETPTTGEETGDPNPDW